MLQVSQEMFAIDRIPEDTKELNAKIIGLSEASPDMWQFTPDQIRQARLEGKSVFSLEEQLASAETIEIDGLAGKVPLRVVEPDAQSARGVFLHIHGGGWMLGSAMLQDQRLKEMANQTGLTCMSVEYRLSPENPYPAGPDDCEAAALWLATKAEDQYDTSFLAIGGESAGAHLSVNAILRLRDKHALKPFGAAVLIAGAYDMNQTPSTKRFDMPLILRQKDVQKFGEAFLQNNEDRNDPDVSPIFADLSGMPPAHFTVGTYDALLDDTLFMANRWVQQQSDTELEVYPGGCHVFHYFPHLQQSKQSWKNIYAFLNRLISA